MKYRDFVKKYPDGSRKEFFAIQIQKHLIEERIKEIEAQIASLDPHLNLFESDEKRDELKMLLSIEYTKLHALAKREG